MNMHAPLSSEWHQLLKMRAGSVLPPTRKAAALAGLMQARDMPIDEATAQGWLDGKGLPGRKQYEPLMEALGLPRPKKFQLPSNANKQIDAWRARFDHAYKQAESGVEPAPQPVQPQHHPDTDHDEPLHSHPALDCARVHGGGEYQRLSPDELVHMRDHTRHAAEYLRCHRLLLGMTQLSMREWLGENYKQIECGISRGAPETLEQLRESPLFATRPDAFARFEALTIRNRLAIREACLNGPMPQLAFKELEEMPHAYWQSVLDDFAGKAPKADWPIVPIETQGDYLRAMRRAMGLTAEKVAEQTGQSAPNVMQLETGKLGLKQESPGRQKLIGFFRERMDGSNGLPKFDEAALNALPLHAAAPAHAVSMGR